MSLDPMYFVKDWIIISLILSVLLCLVKIRRLKKSIIQLKKTLLEENRKRIVPVLILESRAKHPGLYLKNDSDCMAKDIKIRDVLLTLEYDFKKTIILKFDPIEVLGPSKAVKLHYSAFDGGHKVSYTDARNLLLHINRASFEVQIKYKNVEDIAFLTVIIKEKDAFHLKAVNPQSFEGFI